VEEPKEKAEGCRKFGCMGTHTRYRRAYLITFSTSPVRRYGLGRNVVISKTRLFTDIVIHRKLIPEGAKLQ